MKKIGILTQPLHDNYGGLLQAYALKESLKSLGHDPLIINRRSNVASPARKMLSKVKNKLLNRPVRLNQNLNENQKAIISEKTIGFREQYISELSGLITSQQGMKDLLTQDIDTYIVGSDQCWRPRYSPCISNYFLDFAKESKGIKRIAYAASFGTAEWEFNDADTLECKNLLKLFDAISVREDDGVDLVQNHLGRADAIHVLDPTMLLPTCAYDRITADQKVPDSSGNLKVYVLDKNAQKEEFIQQVASRLNLETFEVMPERRLQQETVTDSNVESFKYPCPSQWLKGFQDAEFVITDSFHGTVFSILYNKPFIALGNERRGMSRFTSLLRMFGLEDRLVSDLKADRVFELLEQSVDWLQVNKILGREREKAMNFLKDTLES